MIWNGPRNPRGRRAGKGVPTMSEPTKAPRSKSRLGRGLSSLISISDVPAEAPAEALSTGATPVMREITPPAPRTDEPVDPPLGVRVFELPLSAIVPNPHQPRRQFDE